MKYQITVPVTQATGWQAWEVEANSEDEAIEMLKAGAGELVDEEIEVWDIDLKRAAAEPVDD